MFLEDYPGNNADVIIKVRSNKCNLWPNCRILLNDQIIFDGHIEEQQAIDAALTLRDENSIRIIHHGKRFGENRIWDTKLENGHIVADRSMHVEDIVILGISIKRWWHRGSMLVDSNTETIPEHSDALHFFKNAEYKLSFSAPFYDWLIDSRREGFKEVGPIWKMSSLNTKSDGYSSSMLELEPILDRIRDGIDRLK